MAKLLFERQVLLIRAMMVKGPEAISEILESTSLIKVQNPSGAEWSREDWLQGLLCPYHSGGPRIPLPTSHCGSAQPQPAVARVYPGVPLFTYPKHPISKAWAAC